MPFPLVCVFLYVMVYTANYGRMIWRSGNKFASVIVLLMAAMIPALLMLLRFYS